MKIRPVFKWFDLWVGVFVDVPKRRLYLFPVPMFGLVFELGPARPEFIYGMTGNGLRGRLRTATGAVEIEMRGGYWATTDPSWWGSFVPDVTSSATESPGSTATPSGPPAFASSDEIEAYRLEVFRRDQAQQAKAPAPPAQPGSV